jgi:hypothetical protein
MTEKQLLQITVALGALVPIFGGLTGIAAGPNAFTASEILLHTELDSHMRYLSGLLFAIGLGFLYCVPGIEAKGKFLRGLVLIVLIGGMARLLGVMAHGMPAFPMNFALFMELIVTPAIGLWQIRIEKRYQRDAVYS